MGIIPEIPITNISDSKYNDVLRQFNKITIAKTQIDNLDEQISEALSAAKILNDAGNLPPIPSAIQMAEQFGIINDDISSKFAEFENIDENAGPCLAAGINYLKELSNDALSYVDDVFDFSGFTFPNPDFPNLPDLSFPTFALDLESLLGKKRNLIGQLGIDAMIQDILSTKIPCLDDAALIATSVAEINSLTDSLGLELDGSLTDNSFGTLIESQLSAQGLPSTLAEGMTLMNNEKSKMISDVKSKAKQKALSFVPKSVKSFVPKKFF